MKKPNLSTFAPPAKPRPGEPKPEEINIVGITPIMKRPKARSIATGRPSATEDRPIESNHRDTTVDTVIPRHHETINDTTVSNELIDHIRAEVYKVGEKAATHRFTEEEKREIATIAFTYHQAGNRKANENTIVRIGLHWLIRDYKQNGENSVLHKALEALNR